MYPVQCVLKSDAGAVIDTGAQRSDAKHSDEILQRTNTSHSMQGAFGQPTTMKGILMGCSTVDIQEIPLTLVIPDESVCDPLLSDSLVSAGRLMEAGFEIIFRLPKDALTDGFQLQKYPQYGGTITTPKNPYYRPRVQRPHLEAAFTPCAVTGRKDIPYRHSKFVRCAP
jgi:hypothetical protein